MQSATPPSRRSPGREVTQPVTTFVIPVSTLRELFRHLQAWQALYESDGTDTLTAPDGQEYCLQDIQQLYKFTQSDRMDSSAQLVPVLSGRQSQAIRMFLYENRRERDVAILMGVSETNPVASYATQGMVRLNELIAAGAFPTYRPYSRSA